MSKTKWIRVFALLIGTSALLSFGVACNTMHGAGEDTEKAGEKLQDAADRNK